MQASPVETAALTALLHSIGQKYEASHPYREEIIRSLVQILLHEIGPVYSAQHASSKAVQMRRQQIAIEFK